jgi:hypothetical protein
VTEADLRAFQRHLEDVLRGKAFRGSHRSARFLEYIVERSIHGHGDELKERVIGIELFGRLPTYDTGEDAIVRVTASDVRKRLMQHYGISGTGSDFRINLPLGSYIPEIVRNTVSIVEDVEAVPLRPVVVRPITSEFAETQTTSEADPPHVLPDPVSERMAGVRWWRAVSVPLLIALTCINLVVCVAFAMWTPKRNGVGGRDTIWASLFPLPANTELITSDPNIEEIQATTGQTVSLSDYANRLYVPQPEKVSPQLLGFARNILRGDKAAGVDTGVAVRIGQLLAQNPSNHLTIHMARDMRLSDMLADANFILLGSARSNPWTLFYSDHLDFRIVYDPASGQEIVQNAHPRSGEPVSYIPTAKGFATGQSYATASYLANPNRRGHVLLIAGANAEGTQAAGEFMTDSVVLKAAMTRCGLPLADSIPSFQFLLRLNMMAGSPAHFEVVACHVLSA